MRLQPRDQLDRKLLALLENNARVSASQLARQLRVARSTVNDRIARLERDGIIQGYTTITAPDPNASQSKAIVFLKCELRLIKTILNDLRCFTEIRECYSTAGVFDLSCIVEVQYLEDLDALIDEICLLNGVHKAESQVLLATKFSRTNGLRRAEPPHLEVVK